MNHRKQLLIHGLQKNFNHQQPTSPQIGRVPAQAVELEEAVLGVLLLEPNVQDEVIALIRGPEVFYKPSHQLIYQAIQRIYNSSRAVDMFTVLEELNKTEDIKEVGGPFELARLTQNVTSGAHVIAHTRILLEKYAIRNVVATASSILQQAYQNDVDAFELIEFAEKEIMQLSLTQTSNELTHISVPTKEFKADTEYKIANKVKSTGIMSGIHHLDNITNGWQKTDLIILAARPSVGKTAFALNIVRNAAREGKKTAIFSLEMGINQLVNRLVAMSGEVSLGAIKDPSKMAEKDITGVFRVAIPEIENLPIYFDDKSGLSITQLKSKCRRLKSKHGIDMVVIDYLQLMSGGTKYRGNREQEIAEISRELKSLAKELDIPVIALSQLSRGVEGRAEKKPMLSDLRESGAIEQDADIVMFLYRPLENDIKNNSLLKHATFLDIAKHRNGELDSMPLFRDLSIQKFFNSPNELKINQNESRENDFIDNTSINTYHSRQTANSEDEDLPF